MGRADAQAATASLKDQRRRRVKRVFAELPGRYLGAAADFDATFQIRLGDVGRTWEVRAHGSRCDVHPSLTRDPDVVIGTDASTWLALRDGRMSGLDAFAEGRLYARNALWFAAAVQSYMDAMAIDEAHLVGNSMGGRIALEVAFVAPARVASLSLLAPSLAFRRRRELVPLVRLLRPELAAIPHPLRTATVREQLRGLFARPERLDPAAAEIAVNEFCRTYRSRAARVAFFAAARNIYLEEPHGADGFYARLAGLEPPALFIWGDRDRIVPAAFARHVERACPRSCQVVLAECGHAPQVELAERTNRLVRDQIESCAPGAAVAPPRRLADAIGRRAAV